MEIFLPIIQGNREEKIGITEVQEDRPYRYSPDHTTIYVPLGSIESANTDQSPVVKKGTLLKLNPSCKFNITSRNYKMIVEAHPELYAQGNINYQRIFDFDNNQQPVVYVQCYRKFDFESLPYLFAVRIAGL